MSEQLDTTKTSGATRRTVLKGAAWSAPVIAAAIAVPMAAASGTPPVATRYTASATGPSPAGSGSDSDNTLSAGGYNQASHAAGSIPTGTSITLTVTSGAATIQQVFDNLTVTDGTAVISGDTIVITPTAYGTTTTVYADITLPVPGTVTISISGTLGATSASATWN